MKIKMAENFRKFAIIFVKFHECFGPFGKIFEDFLLNDVQYDEFLNEEQNYGANRSGLSKKKTVEVLCRNFN